MTTSRDLSHTLARTKGLQNGLVLIEHFTNVDLWWTPEPFIKAPAQAKNPCKSLEADARTRTGGPLHYEGKTTGGHASTRGHDRAHFSWRPGHFRALAVDARARPCPR